MSAFDPIYEFEQALGLLTGAPFVVMTDCCTHALELCLRYERVTFYEIPSQTYISIPMVMRKLNKIYIYTDVDWIGEYRLGPTTRIWDSARLLRADMYRSGMMQCLSFGHGKPLDIGHGGAILLDDAVAYNKLIKQRYDGRDLKISPWESQKTFEVGYHYRPTIEDAVRGLELLPTVDQTPKYHNYPNLKEITIK